MDFFFFLFLSLCYSCAVHVAVLIFGLVVLQAQLSGFCMAGCFEKRRPSSLSASRSVSEQKDFQSSLIRWDECCGQNMSMCLVRNSRKFTSVKVNINTFFFTFLNVNLWKKCVFYVKENTNMSKT